MEPQIAIKMRCEIERRLQPDFFTSTPVHKRRRTTNLNHFFDKTPVPEIPRLTIDNEFNILGDRKPFRELNHIEKRFNLPSGIDLIPLRKNADIPRLIGPSTSSAPRRESNRPSFAPLVVATSDDENSAPYISISDNLFNFSIKDILKNKIVKKIESEKKVVNKNSIMAQRKASCKKTVLDYVCEGEEDNTGAISKKTVKATEMKRNVRRKTTAGPSKVNRLDSRDPVVVESGRRGQEEKQKRKETEQKGGRARSAPVKKRNTVPPLAGALVKPHIHGEEEYDLFKSFRGTADTDLKEIWPKSKTNLGEEAAGLVKFNPSSFTEAEWVIVPNEKGVQIKRNFHFSNISQGFIKIKAKSSFSTTSKYHMIIHISDGRAMVDYGGVKERVITGEVLTIPIGTHFQVLNLGIKKDLIMSFIKVISTS